METSEILKIFLPNEIVDNFNLVRVSEHDNAKGKEMHIFLDEKHQYPDAYQDKQLESKGFAEPVNICDFPIQNKKVKLRMRKRRWVDKETNEYISKSYDFKHKGTSYSKDLASFLKDGVR